MPHFVASLSGLSIQGRSLRDRRFLTGQEIRAKRRTMSDTMPPYFMAYGSGVGG
jgi:hypothetical protein